jgi:hypothetical protein
LATLGSNDAVVLKMKEWSRNVVTYKYVTGVATTTNAGVPVDAANALEHDLADVAKARSLLTQFTVVASGATGYFSMPTWFGDKTTGVITAEAKSYIPISYSGSTLNVSEMGWILSHGISRKELIEGIQIAKILDTSSDPTYTFAEALFPVGGSAIADSVYLSAATIILDATFASVAPTAAAKLKF